MFSRLFLLLLLCSACVSDRRLIEFFRFYRWTNQGNKKPLPRTNPKYLKSYYYIKTENRSNKGFRKDVHFPVGTGNIIVHYLGDESLSVMMPHGNSNKKEPYFRTKPSVKEEIQKKIEVEKPHIRGVIRKFAENSCHFYIVWLIELELQHTKLQHICSWSVTTFFV